MVIDRAIRVRATCSYVDPLRDAQIARIILAACRRLLLAEFPASDAINGIVQFARLVGSDQAAEGLRATISQRLIRLLCNKCKLAYRPNPKMLAKIGLRRKRKRFTDLPPSRNSKRHSPKAYPSSPAKSAAAADIWDARNL